MVQRIQSVERALAMLDILAKSPRPQTIPELAKTMEINRATAWRLINTLLEFELVEKMMNRGDSQLESAHLS